MGFYIFLFTTLHIMADVLSLFDDIDLDEVLYFVVIKGPKSLAKGLLNKLHLRKKHQCKWHRDEAFLKNLNKQNTTRM
jgi:hypothetical protein